MAEAAPTPESEDWRCYAHLYGNSCEGYARAQRFFAKLADAARAPACGDHFKSIITDLLKQAQAVHLYEPPTEQT